MKILQNHFTTQEQSKRLLELGVPADSADCYHNTIAGKPFILSKPYSDNNWFDKNNPPLPCWSVGRLIEIITICREEIYTRLYFSRVDDHTNIENLIHYMSAEIENGHIDFSKLDNYDTRN